MAVVSGSFHFSLCPLPSSSSYKSTRWNLGKRGPPPSSSLLLRCSSAPDDPKRISEQSSWESKDSEGKDYLYRLGQEADNMNISVGARQGVIDDLFVGNFLGKDYQQSRISMEAAAAAGWNSHVGMEGDVFDQWEAMEQLSAQQIADLQQSLSSENHHHSLHPEPKNSLKTRSASSPSILSFGKPENYDSFVGVVSPKKEMDVLQAQYGSKRNFETMFGQQQASNFGASVVKKPSYNNKEHIVAERKRREKLNQRFIALAAIVPGIKKTDKASVLSDAIEHLKQLQEKVSFLEDQTAKKTIESAVWVKKSDHLRDDDGISELLPKIEAKMFENTVLVKIHCEKHKGVVVKALSEMEKIHLSVVNTSVILFTSSSLDITVMAKMEEGFNITAEDVVKKLSSAFRQLH